MAGFNREDQRLACLGLRHGDQGDVVQSFELDDRLARTRSPASGGWSCAGAVLTKS